MVRMVSYAANDAPAGGVPMAGYHQSIQATPEAKWQAPGARGPGRPGRVRSCSPRRAAQPLLERRAASRDRPRLRPAAVSALSNCARSKIGDAPPLPPRKPGHVPKYLNRRKAELADQKAAAEAERTRERIPAGYRKVDSEEQLDTLAILQQRKEQTEKAYERLPLRLTTAAQRQFKEKLEARLEYTEKMLKAFSKPKVLVPADCPPIELGEEDDECAAEAAKREPHRGAVHDHYGSTEQPASHTSTKVLGPPGGFSSLKLG